MMNQNMQRVESLLRRNGYRAASFPGMIRVLITGGTRNLFATVEITDFAGFGPADAASEVWQEWNEDKAAREVVEDMLREYPDAPEEMAQIVSRNVARGAAAAAAELQGLVDLLEAWGETDLEARLACAEVI